MAVARTVLVIDDDPDVREALQMVLEGRGLRVECAEDGEAGIADALRDPPDLMILDMMMPRASGFVVLERLKQQRGLPVPVIMLTANDSDHQRAYAEFLGVDVYLCKPVRPAQLFQAVDRFCPPAAVPVPGPRRPDPRRAGSPVRTVTGPPSPGAPCPPTFKAVPTPRRNWPPSTATCGSTRSSTRNPKTLTLAQVERFNRDGYLKPFRIFDATPRSPTCGHTSTACSRSTVAEGKDSYSISSAHLRHGRVWDVLTHPRIVALVSDLLGPSVVAWGSHFFCKMPQRRQDGELAPGRELLAAHARRRRSRCGWRSTTRTAATPA